MTYNAELFREQLAIGHRCAEIVGRALSDHGCEVEVTPMEWRWEDGNADTARCADEIDLMVEGRKVDVKSRALRFTGPGDYPYATAFVDTVTGWDAKPSKPVAVVLVTQTEPHGFAVIPGSTAATWTKQTAFDRVRQITTTFYMVRREQLRTLDEFGDWLLGG